MQITPLELGLAALAVVVVFGPKHRSGLNNTVDDRDVDLSSMAPSQHAAGRAPSPLAQAARQERQYAMTGYAPAQQQQRQATPDER